MTKTQARIMREKVERERLAFIEKESALDELEKSPLSHTYSLETYDAVSKRLEQRGLESEYLVDERDGVEGDVSDSDEEFEAIIEIDGLIKELTEVYEANVREEDSVRHYHERMVIIMNKIKEIVDLVEFENPDLWRVFDEIIAHELFDMSNYE